MSSASYGSPRQSAGGAPSALTSVCVDGVLGFFLPSSRSLLPSSANHQMKEVEILQPSEGDRVEPVGADSYPPLISICPTLPIDCISSLSSPILSHRDVLRVGPGKNKCYVFRQFFFQSTAFRRSHLL